MESLFQNHSKYQSKHSLKEQWYLTRGSHTRKYEGCSFCDVCSPATSKLNKPHHVTIKTCVRRNIKFNPLGAQNCRTSQCGATIISLSFRKVGKDLRGTHWSPSKGMASQLGMMELICWNKDNVACTNQSRWGHCGLSFPLNECRLQDNYHIWESRYV